MARKLENGNEHKIPSASVILFNKFMEAVTKGPLPLWIIRRLNEGTMAGNGADYPVRKLAVNYRTYYSS